WRFSRLFRSVVQVVHQVAPKLRITIFPPNASELTGRPDRSGSENAGAGVRSGRTKTDESCATPTPALEPTRQTRQRRTRRTIQDLPLTAGTSSQRDVSSLLIAMRLGREAVSGKRYSRISSVFGSTLPTLWVPNSTKNTVPFEFTAMP